MTRSTSGYTRRDMGPLAVGAVGAMSGARAFAATPAKPNILILIADDAGARHFGLYGNETVDTPNLDALGRGGLVGDHAFCQRNWHNCDEHMRGIRTGRYKLITNAYTDLPHGTAADIGSSPAYKDLLAARSSGQLTPAQQRLFEVPRPAVELYDLDADPFELDNRADDPGLADVRADLLGRLETWHQATGDFPPWRRRRADNTDRQTGVKFWPEHHLPPLFDTGS